MSILVSVVSPSSRPERKVQVSSADMQYATTLLLSGVHLGLPQNPPCWEMRLRPLPSGWIRYTSTMCRRSQRPLAGRRSLSRSEEKAIHFPSGDQEGRKSPPSPEVSGVALRLATSRTKMLALPAARVDPRDHHHR